MKYRLYRVNEKNSDDVYGLYDPKLIRFGNESLGGTSSDAPLIANRCLPKIGKQYFEIEVVSIKNAASIGLCNPNDGYFAGTSSEAPLTGVYVWLNGYTNQYRLMIVSSGNIAVLNDINDVSPIATYGVVIDFSANAVQLYRNGELVCANDCASTGYELKDIDLYPYIKFGTSSTIQGMFNFGETAFKYEIPDGCVSVYDAVRSNAFTKLTDNWSALTETEKTAMFEATNHEVPTLENLKTLDKFKVLTLSDLSDKQTLQVRAVPKPQLVLPKGLIPLDSFAGIKQMRATATMSTSAACWILVTTDLSSYYTYDAVTAQWNKVDITDVSAITKGIEAADLANIPAVAWDTLVSGAKGIGFAYLLNIEQTADICEVDTLEMIVDMKGSWDMALPGTDYTYGYPLNTVLRVRLKTDGDYKINYEGTSGNFGDVGDVALAYVVKADFVKANGALVNREDYPLLYSFAAAKNLIVTEAEWAGGMQGLYSEGDGSTTFRLPDLRGQFLRGLDMGAGVDEGRILGSVQGDAIRNITGGTMDVLIPSLVSTTHTGAFSPTQLDEYAIDHIANQTNDNYVYKAITSFDASRVVPTAEENRPKNIALVAQIKYR